MVNCADFIASLAQILNKTLNLLVRKKKWDFETISKWPQLLFSLKGTAYINKKIGTHSWYSNLMIPIEHSSKKKNRTRARAVKERNKIDALRGIRTHNHKNNSLCSHH